MLVLPSNKGKRPTGRLETSTADEEAIDVRFLAEVLAVLLADAAAVEDASLVGYLLADVGLEPVPDGGMDFLRLLSGSDLASTNGPNGLVGDDDLAPVAADMGAEDAELPGNHVDSLACLALFERLAAAPDDANARVDGKFGLGGDQLVRLAEDGAALRVAQDGPVDVAVLELGNRDLAREGAIRLIEDVLRSDVDTSLQVFAYQEEVERRRCDNDLCNRPC